MDDEGKRMSYAVPMCSGYDGVAIPALKAPTSTKALSEQMMADAGAGIGAFTRKGQTPDWAAA